MQSCTSLREEKEINTLVLNNTSPCYQQVDDSTISSEMINPSQDSFNLIQELNKEYLKNENVIQEELKTPLIDVKMQPNCQISYENFSTQQSISFEHQVSHKQYQEYQPPKLHPNRQRNKFKHYFPEHQPIHSFCIQYSDLENEFNQHVNNPWHIDYLKCFFYICLIIGIIIIASYIFRFLFNAVGGTQQND